MFKCESPENGGELVAVKVIKNQTAYYHQARVEIGVLQFLNTRADPDDSCHIVRLKDFFLHKNHLCLVFELLNLNIFELIRHNKFRGLSLSLVRVFLNQVLKALVVLHSSSIIHCDIKPENILLTDGTSGEVKLIDLGSACFSNRTVYTYIQSRFYRSPEVVLGCQYNMAVDMWSLGCVAAEMFLGLPLFPAACELDLLGRVSETIAPIPAHILAQGKNTSKFYTPGVSTPPSLRLRTPDEFTEATGQKAPRGKQYFQHKALADIISAYPFRSGPSEAELLRERANREIFTDFLLGLLDVDPYTRWTPRQAQAHPFITGAPFTGPFQPAADPTVVVATTPMTTTTTHAASSFLGGAGIPVTIPQPRPRYVHTAPATNAAATAAMEGFTAALLASSPQMHAQAHAAAMAAVQMQMNLQQQQQQQRAASTAAGPSSGDFVVSSSSPYVAAHSLQRIMDSVLSSPAFGNRFNSENVAGVGIGSDGQWRMGAMAPSHPSLPSTSTPLFSPPSRSVGVHIQPMPPPELPPPSFDPSHPSTHRIVPLMHLPAPSTAIRNNSSSNNANATADASPVPFQPSSVSTYRSALAAVAAQYHRRHGGGGGGGGDDDGMPPPPPVSARATAVVRDRENILAANAAARRPHDGLEENIGTRVGGGLEDEKMVVGGSSGMSAQQAWSSAAVLNASMAATIHAASQQQQQQQGQQEHRQPQPQPQQLQLQSKQLVTIPVLDDGAIGAASSGDGSTGGTPERKVLLSAAQQQAQEEAAPNPSDWDPLWNDDLLAEEEASPAAAAAMSAGDGGGDTTTRAKKMLYAPASPGPSKTKDSGLSLAMQHLTQLQPLQGGTPPAPTSGLSLLFSQQAAQQASSWPAGSGRGGGEMMQDVNMHTIGASPTNAMVGGGEGGDGESMLWSPPRAAPLMKPQQQSQHHQEPLQRLHGFVVSSQPLTKQEEEQGDGEEDPAHNILDKD